MPVIIKFEKKKVVRSENQLRNNIWTMPEECMDDFYDYLTYIEENTLKEYKIYGSEGASAALDKLRMPTLQGFCYYLRCTIEAMKDYGERDDEWRAVFSFIQTTMYAITIEGAAAGLIKETVAMRKLDLVDRREITNTQKRVVILHTPDNGRAQIVGGNEQQPKFILNPPRLQEGPEQ